MNRRDFLKLGSLGLLPLAFCEPTQPFDLVSAFAALGDGDVLDIPPGVHYVTDTLRPGSGNYHIVRGNNAIISPVGDFSGRPVVDLSSVKYGRFDNLRVLAGENDSAYAGILMGRAASDGAGHILNQCVVQGAFTQGVLVNLGAEGYMLNQCNLITENSGPAMLIDGPVAGGQHNQCAFRNYGGREGVPLVDLHGTLSGLDFSATCYYYTGSNGHAFRVNGPEYGVVIRGRVEGTGEGTRLLVNHGTSTLYNWTVEQVLYTPQAECMIETSKIIHECLFDFVHSAGCPSAKYFRLTGYGPRLWRCEVHGNRADWVMLIDGAQIRMNYLYWTQGAPLVNAGDNVIFYAS